MFFVGDLIESQFWKQLCHLTPKKYVPCTSLDESGFEFDFETGLNLYLDMRDTHLSL